MNLVPRFLNRETGESKGTGKVEFQTAELAQKAIQARPELQCAAVSTDVQTCVDKLSHLYTFVPFCTHVPQSKTQWHDVAHEKNTPEAQHAAKEQAYTGMLLFIVDKNNQIQWS